MKSIKDVVNEIQQKPYESRVRILWTVVLGFGAIIVIIFILNIKNTIGNLDGANLIKVPDSKINTPESKVNYMAVEQAEQDDKTLKIYFNFNNTTDDILTISELQKITLNVDGNQINAQSITDRQGNPFVQKILSRTQNFGILTFPFADSKKTATLTFDEMFFEKNIEDVFQQKLELNLEELIKTNKVRN